MSSACPATRSSSRGPCSTQSISNVLDVIEATATARTAVLASAGITTAQLGVGLPGFASIYAGYVQIPYFGDPANPLTSFWVNADLMPPTGASPVPIARVPQQRIPLLATLPNATSGRTQPAAGWPVVIFQHGITLNRTVMFAIADAFAQAGFAVVAIDLPLHGITDTANPFYQGAASPFGSNERHFNRDSVGATGVYAPDGQIDNGWQILNLQNPLNARDHIRQAVSDTIHLTRTIGSLNFPDGDPNPDLDPARIHFVAVSLGSIIGGVFLGLNGEVGTATLSSPAGPLDLDPHGPGSDRLRRADPRGTGGAGPTPRHRWIRQLRPRLADARRPGRSNQLRGRCRGNSSAARDRGARRYDGAERSDRFHRVVVGPSERARDDSRHAPEHHTRHRAVQSGRALVVVQSRDQPGRYRRDAARDGGFCRIAR